MDLITNVVLSVYTKITPDIIEYSLSGNGACIFYLIGYCEREHEMQMYKIGCKVNKTGDGYDIFKEKCFADTLYELDGSGASFLSNKGDINSIVQDFYKEDPMYGPLNLLQSIIDDDDCKSVGGAIQYAKCTPTGSSIYSMLKNNDGNFFYLRGGVDLNKLIDETLEYGVMIDAKMIMR